MRPHDGRVDHRVLVVGIVRQGFEKISQNAAHGPTRESLVRIAPAAETSPGNRATARPRGNSRSPPQRIGPICCGWLISRIFRHGPASSIWRSCSMPSAVGSSAGRWRPPCTAGGARCPRYGALAATAEWRDPPFGSGLAIYLDRVRQTMSGGGCSPLDGIGRRRLRQRDGGELLRHARMRVARSASLQDASRSAHCCLRVRRGLLQSAPSTLIAQVSVSRHIRASRDDARTRSPSMPPCSRLSRSGLETSQQVGPPTCRPSLTAARHDSVGERAGRDKKMLSAKLKDRPKEEDRMASN